MLFFSVDVKVAAPIPPEYVLPTPRPTVSIFSTSSQPELDQNLTSYRPTVSDVLIMSSLVLLLLVLAILMYNVLNIVKIRNVSSFVSQYQPGLNIVYKYRYKEKNTNSWKSVDCIKN